VTFSYRGAHRLGVDALSAVVAGGQGNPETASDSVEWVQPRCPPQAGGKFVRFFKDAACVLQPVLQVGECAISVFTSFKIKVEAADALYKLLINYSIFNTADDAYHWFTKYRTARAVAAGLPGLLQNLKDGQLVAVGEKLANIAGFGSCLNVVAGAVPS
jgi:hypothetical protein